jgi:hypothetical protein
VSTARGAVEHETAAERFDAVGEPAQASARPIRAADAVVRDGDRQPAVVGRRVDDDALRTRMLVDIGQRLGDDVVGAGLDLLGNRLVEREVKLDGQRRPQGKGFEGGDEPALGEHRGVQAACELADLVEACSELVDREHEQGIGLGCDRAQAPEGEQHGRQPLLRPVVEVALDALALGVGDLDQSRTRRLQLVLGAYAVRDVPEVAGEGRRSRQRDPRGHRPRDGGSDRAARPAPDLVLDAPACHELADLASESAHRRQQALVGLVRLFREELHDTDHAARTAQREAERGVKPAPTRRGRAREVGIVGCVHHPRGLAAGEETAGQSFAGAQREGLAQALELRCRHAGVPRAHAPQPAARGVELPDRSQLPAQARPISSRAAS